MCKTTGIAGLVIIAALVMAGCRDGSDSGTLTPCWNPAPLNGTPDQAAPGFLVGIHRGLDVREEADRLAGKYGFTVEYVEPAWFFVPELTPDMIEGLRCEPTVAYVEYNALLHTEQRR